MLCSVSDMRLSTTSGPLMDPCKYFVTTNHKACVNTKKKSHGIKINKYIQVCDNAKNIKRYNDKESKYDPGVKTKCDCDNTYVEGFKNVEFNLFDGDQASLTYFLTAKVLPMCNIGDKCLTIEDGNLKFDVDPEDGLTECYEQTVGLDGCKDNTPTVIKNIAKLKDTCDNVLEKACTEANICCTKIEGKFNITIGVDWSLKKEGSNTRRFPTNCEGASQYIAYTVTVSSTVAKLASYDLKLNFSACGKSKGRLPYDKKFNWTLLHNSRKIQTGKLNVRAGTDISAYPIRLTFPNTKSIKLTDKIILRLKWDNELFSLSDCEKTFLESQSSMDIVATLIDDTTSNAKLTDIVTSAIACNNNTGCSNVLNPGITIKPVDPDPNINTCVYNFINDSNNTSVTIDNDAIPLTQVPQVFGKLLVGGYEINPGSTVVIKYLVDAKLNDGSAIIKITNIATLKAANIKDITDTVYLCFLLC